MQDARLTGERVPTSSDYSDSSGASGGEFRRGVSMEGRYKAYGVWSRGKDQVKGICKAFPWRSSPPVMAPDLHKPETPPTEDHEILNRCSTL